MDEGRLDRLESKLDTVVVSLQALVRLEEKHVSHDRRLEKLETQLNEQEQRIRGTEEKVNASAFVSGAVERFFWVVVTAATGAIGIVAGGWLNR